MTFLLSPATLANTPSAGIFARADAELAIIENGALLLTLAQVTHAIEADFMNVTFAGCF